MERKLRAFSVGRMRLASLKDTIRYGRVAHIQTARVVGTGQKQIPRVRIAEHEGMTGCQLVEEAVGFDVEDDPSVHPAASQGLLRSLPRRDPSAS